MVLVEAFDNYVAVEVVITAEGLTLLPCPLHILLSPPKSFVVVH